MASHRSIAAETQRLLTAARCREPRRAGRILHARRVVAFDASIHCAIHACRQEDAAQWVAAQARRCPVRACSTFASDTTAGGGWRGNQVGTQDAPCRNSSLGRALEALPYPLPALGVAYVPEVAVLRVESAPRTLLPPFHVAAVAAALRDVGGDDPDKKQRAFLAAKVRGRAAAAMAAAATRRPRLVAPAVLGELRTLWWLEAFADALGGRFARAFARAFAPRGRRRSRAR